MRNVFSFFILLLFGLMPLTINAQNAPTPSGKAFLGVSVAALPPNFTLPPGQPPVDETKGMIYVHEVTPNGPAEKAGIKVGDGLFAVDCQLMAGVRNFLNIVSSHRPGDRLKIFLIRFIPPPSAGLPPQFMFMDVYPVLVSAESLQQQGNTSPPPVKPRVEDDLILE